MAPKRAVTNTMTKSAAITRCFLCPLVEFISLIFILKKIGIEKGVVYGDSKEVYAAQHIELNFAGRKR